jgi:hypothetical protein
MPPAVANWKFTVVPALKMLSEIQHWNRHASTP